MTERRLVAAVAAASAAATASQVVISRLVAVAAFYHFAFLVLSTAMLGYAAGALYVERRRRAGGDGGDAAAWLARFANAAVVVSAAFMLIGVDSTKAGFTWGATLGLAALGLAAVGPFFAAGALLTSALVDASAPHRLYAAGFAGGALGGLSGLALLAAAGGDGALPLIALGAFAVARAVDARAARLRPGEIAAATLSALAMIAPAAVEQPRAGGKILTWIPAHDRVWSGWSPMGRVDVFRQPYLDSIHYGLWGLAARGRDHVPARLGVTIDHWAYTSIVPIADEAAVAGPATAFLDALPGAAAWLARPGANRGLVIGAGGGLDVLTARRNGAQRIDAVEINPMVERAARVVPGVGISAYTLPGVASIVGDGRSVVERLTHDTEAVPPAVGPPYNVIQLSGVDTHTATSVGGFSLAENWLYTREAFAAYLRALGPDGLLTLTRWHIQDAAGRPRESLRTAVLIQDALARRGAARPGDHVFAFNAGLFACFVVGAAPLDGPTRARLAGFVADNGFTTLYPTGTDATAPYFAAAFEHLNEAATAAYPYDVSPPDDDRPFFFEMRKPGDLWRYEGFISPYGGVDGQSLIVLLTGFLLLVCAVLFVPALRGAGGGPRVADGVYFFALGAGYAIVETALLQRLSLVAGHPTAALALVFSFVQAGSGTASLLAPRLTGGRPLVAAGWAVVAALGAAAAGAAGSAVVGAPVALRWSYVALCAAAVGFGLGTAFPVRFAMLDAGGRTWALAVNGAAAVTGSACAVLIAVHGGFGRVFAAGALCYAAATAAAFVDGYLHRRNAPR